MKDVVCGAMVVPWKLELGMQTERIRGMMAMSFGKRKNDSFANHLWSFSISPSIDINNINVAANVVMDDGNFIGGKQR